MVNFCIILLTILLFLSLAMFFYRVKNREKHSLQTRLAQFSGLDMSLRNSNQQKKVQKDRAFFITKAQEIIRALAGRISKFHESNSFDLKMQQADIPLLGSEFQVVMLIAGIAGSLLMMLLTWQLSAGIWGFILAIVICLMLLQLRISKRRQAFSNQLGDMLTMIANALRAGFSFMQAMDHIAKEMDAPVKTEIRKVVQEVNIGIPLEDALENMNKRVKSSDFELVVAAVLIQRQVGGNLAQILDTISFTINDRLRMRREVHALTSQGRLSGMVLAAIPVVMAIILQIINPHYLDPLINEPVGRIAVGLAIFLVIMAFVVIRRIVDIDI